MRDSIESGADRVAWRILSWEDGRAEHRLGVETATMVGLDDLEIEAETRDVGFAYVASPRRLVRAIIDAVPADPESTVFIDVGSGKGRVLMSAADFPFRRVIGVEFSPELHDIALANLERFRAIRPDAPPIEPRNVDAATFRFPDDDALVYFNNPFSEPVMRRVLANLETVIRSGRRIQVVYQQARREDDPTDNLGLLRGSPWLTERPIRWRRIADRALLRPYEVVRFEGAAPSGPPPGTAG